MVLDGRALRHPRPVAALDRNETFDIGCRKAHF
jgi:hypothetical protein